MIRISVILFFFCCSVCLSSCFEGGDSQLNKPLAISKTNDIVVVADRKLFAGSTGDTLSYYFESPFPIMPRPEELFRLRYFTSEELEAEPLRRQLRTYLILINLADTASGEYKLLEKDLGNQRFEEIKKAGNKVLYGKDKWARDQLVIYVLGNDVRDLESSLAVNFEQIKEKVYGHDEPQVLAATYHSGENINLQNTLAADMGIIIKIPREYQQAMYQDEDEILWMRRDSRRSVINFMLARIRPEDNTNDLKRLALESVTKLGKYVTTNTAGSVLVPNDTDMPVLEFAQVINGNEAIEFRGIWEMTNDFMGGPYVAYLIRGNNSDEYAFFFGFTYGPGDQSKKEYIQQMMVIAKTIDFVK